MADIIGGVAQAIADRAKCAKESGEENFPIDNLFLDETGMFSTWACQMADSKMSYFKNPMKLLTDVLSICNSMNVSTPSIGPKDLPKKIDENNVTCSLNKMLKYFASLVHTKLEADEKTVRDLGLKIAEIIKDQSNLNISTGDTTKDLFAKIIFALHTCLPGTLIHYQKEMVILNTLVHKIHFIMEHVKALIDAEKEEGMTTGQMKLLEEFCKLVSGLSTIASGILNIHTEEIKEVLADPESWVNFCHMLQTLKTDDKPNAELGLKICMSMTLAAELSRIAQKVDEELSAQIMDLVSNTKLVDPYIISKLLQMLEDIELDLSTKDKEQWISYVKLIQSLLFPGQLLMETSGAGIDLEKAYENTLQHMDEARDKKETIQGGSVSCTSDLSVQDQKKILGGVATELNDVDAILSPSISEGLRKNESFLYDQKRQINFRTISDMYDDLGNQFEALLSEVFEYKGDFDEDTIFTLHKISEALKTTVDKTITNAIANVASFAVPDNADTMATMIFLIQLRKISHWLSQLSMKKEIQKKESFKRVCGQTISRINKMNDYVAREIKKKLDKFGSMPNSEVMELYQWVSDKDTNKPVPVKSGEALLQKVLVKHGVVEKMPSFVMMKKETLKGKGAVSINKEGSLEIADPADEGSLYLLLDSLDHGSKSVKKPCPSASKTSKEVDSIKKGLGVLVKKKKQVSKKLKGGADAASPEVKKEVSNMAKSGIDVGALHLKEMAPKIVDALFKGSKIGAFGAGVGGANTTTPEKTYAKTMANIEAHKKDLRKANVGENDIEAFLAGLDKDLEDDSYEGELLDSEFEGGEIPSLVATLENYCGGAVPFPDKTNISVTFLDEDLIGGAPSRGLDRYKKLGENLHTKISWLSNLYNLSKSNDLARVEEKEYFDHTKKTFQGIGAKLSIWTDQMKMRIPDEYKEMFNKWNQECRGALSIILMLERFSMGLRKKLVDVLDKDKLVLQMQSLKPKVLEKHSLEVLDTFSNIICSPCNVIHDYLNAPVNFEVLTNAITRYDRAEHVLIANTGARLATALAPLSPETVKDILTNTNANPIMGMLVGIRETLDTLIFEGLDLEEEKQLMDLIISRIPAALNASQIVFSNPGAWAINMMKSDDIIRDPVVWSSGNDYEVNFITDHLIGNPPQGDFQTARQEGLMVVIHMGTCPYAPSLSLTNVVQARNAPRTITYNRTLNMTDKEKNEEDLYYPFLSGTILTQEAQETDEENPLYDLGRMLNHSVIASMGVISSAALIKRDSTRRAMEEGTNQLGNVLSGLILGGAKKNNTLPDIANKNIKELTDPDVKDKFIIRSDVFSQLFQEPGPLRDTIFNNNPDEWPLILTSLATVWGVNKITGVANHHAKTNEVVESNESQEGELTGGSVYDKIKKTQQYLNTIKTIRGLDRVTGDVDPAYTKKVFDVLVGLAIIERKIQCINDQMSKFRKRDTSVIMIVPPNDIFKTLFDCLEWENYICRYRRELNKLMSSEIYDDLEFFSVKYLVAQQFLKTNKIEDMCAFLQELQIKSMRYLDFTDISLESQEQLFLSSKSRSNNVNADTLESSIDLYARRAHPFLQNSEFQLGSPDMFTLDPGMASATEIYTNATKSLEYSRPTVAMLSSIQKAFHNMSFTPDTSTPLLPNFEKQFITATCKTKEEETSEMQLYRIASIWQKYMDPTKKMPDSYSAIWTQLLLDTTRSLWLDIKKGINLIIALTPLFFYELMAFYGSKLVTGANLGANDFWDKIAYDHIKKKYSFLKMTTFFEISQTFKEGVTEFSTQLAGQTTNNKQYRPVHFRAFNDVLANGSQHMIMLSGEGTPEENAKIVTKKVFPLNYSVITLIDTMSVLNGLTSMNSHSLPASCVDKNSVFDLTDMTNTCNSLLVITRLMYQQENPSHSQSNPDPVSATLSGIHQEISELTKSTDGTVSMCHKLKELSVSAIRQFKDEFIPPILAPGHAVGTEILIGNSLADRIFPTNDLANPLVGLILDATNPVHKYMLICKNRTSDGNGHVYPGTVSHMALHDIGIEGSYMTRGNIVRNTLSELNKHLGILIQTGCHYDKYNKCIYVLTPIITNLKTIIAEFSHEGYYPDFLPSFGNIHNYGQEEKKPSMGTVDIKAIIGAQPVTEFLISHDLSPDKIAMGTMHGTTNGNTIGLGFPKETMVICESLQYYLTTFLSNMGQANMVDGSSSIKLFPSMKDIDDDNKKRVYGNITAVYVHLTSLFRTLKLYKDSVRDANVSHFDPTKFSAKYQMKRMNPPIPEITASNELMLIPQTWTPASFKQYLMVHLECQMSVCTKLLRACEEHIQEIECSQFMYKYDISPLVDTKDFDLVAMTVPIRMLNIPTPPANIGQKNSTAINNMYTVVLKESNANVPAKELVHGEEIDIFRDKTAQGVNQIRKYLGSFQDGLKEAASAKQFYIKLVKESLHGATIFQQVNQTLEKIDDTYDTSDQCSLIKNDHPLPISIMSLESVQAWLVTPALEECIAELQTMNLYFTKTLPNDDVLGDKKMVLDPQQPVAQGAGVMPVMYIGVSNHTAITKAGADALAKITSLKTTATSIDLLYQELVNEQPTTNSLVMRKILKIPPDVPIATGDNVSHRHFPVCTPIDPAAMTTATEYELLEQHQKSKDFLAGSIVHSTRIVLFKDKISIDLLKDLTSKIKSQVGVSVTESTMEHIVYGIVSYYLQKFSANSIIMRYPHQLASLCNQNMIFATCKMAFAHDITTIASILSHDKSCTNLGCPQTPQGQKCNRIISEFSMKYRLPSLLNGTKIFKGIIAQSNSVVNSLQFIQVIKEIVPEVMIAQGYKYMFDLYLDYLIGSYDPIHSFFGAIILVVYELMITKHILTRSELLIGLVKKTGIRMCCNTNTGKPANMEEALGRLNKTGDAWLCSYNTDGNFVAVKGDVLGEDIGCFHNHRAKAFFDCTTTKQTLLSELMKDVCAWISRIR